MTDEPRSPRNPLMGGVWRDYRYADARDMGIRLRMIRRAPQASGKAQHAEPLEAVLTVVVPRATQTRV